MRIAILGGSFNPLHIGHAMLADTMVRELGYDKVLFIPTCIPPHKEITSNISTDDRIGMVDAFCRSVPGGIFELETCEIDRGGVSYTIDTVKYIINKYKNILTDKPALLMGEEIAAQFSKWKEPDAISILTDIIIVPRYPDIFGRKLEKENSFSNRPVGHFVNDFSVKFNKNTFNYPCRVLDIPIVPVSSTEIRGRIATGRSYKYLVPTAVFEYIEKETLYKWVSTDVSDPNIPDVTI